MNFKILYKIVFFCGPIILLTGCEQKNRLQTFEKFLVYSDGRISELLETKLVEGGRPIRLQIIYKKPSGDGPFPLLFLNHGSTGRGDDPSRFRQPHFYRAIANYFVDRGWMVAMPQRRGRGWSDGLYDEGFDPSRSRYTCETYYSLRGADRALTDVSAAYDVLVKRSEVDRSRIIIGGVSRGGILSVAFAGKNPKKVRGVINFVGGWMGDGCSTATEINGTLARDGAPFPHQMLWIYSEGDRYYSVQHSRGNFQKFIENGGKGEFFVLGQGHGSWRQVGSWSRTVNRYMTGLGFSGFEKAITSNTSVPQGTGFPTALPSNTRVVAPGDDTATEIAAYSGKWAGTWSGGLPAGLVVEEISGTTAVVIYSWGLGRSSEPGWFRLVGKFVNGQLRVKTPRASVTYTMRPDGKLDAQYSLAGDIWYATLMKIDDPKM